MTQQRLQKFGLSLLASFCAGMVGCSSSVSTSSRAESQAPAAVQPSAAQLQNETTGGSGASLSTSVAAAFELFQAPQSAPGWTNQTSNRGNGPTGPFVNNGVSVLYSIGAYVDPNDSNKMKFFANDRGNNRLLIFNQIPSGNSATPDVVVGQADFTTAGKNASSSPSTVSNAGFDTNNHVAVCANGYMFVSDSGNNRVLGYKKVPTANGAVADFVIGQPDFASRTANNPALGLQSQRLSSPYAVHCIAGKLYLLDKANTRVLVFNTIPTAGPPGAAAPAADLAIGQPDLNTITTGSGDYSASTSYLNSPYELSTDNGKLYIADGGNHRVLVFNSIPTAANAKPDFVVGQPDSATVGFNNTNSATPTQSSLYYPNSLAFNAGKMAVSDHSNGRIMFFDVPIASNGPNASAMLGHADYVTGGFPSPQQGTFGGTKGLIFDGTYIWVCDGSSNNRIQVLPLPY